MQKAWSAMCMICEVHNICMPNLIYSAQMNDELCCVGDYKCISPIRYSAPFQKDFGKMSFYTRYSFYSNTLIQQYWPWTYRTYEVIVVSYHSDILLFVKITRTKTNKRQNKIALSSKATRHHKINLKDNNTRSTLSFSKISIIPAWDDCINLVRRSYVMFVPVANCKISMMISVLRCLWLKDIHGVNFDHFNVLHN